MTVAGQTAVTYSYDDADRLTGIAQGTATVSLAYDNASRRTSLTLPNGIVVEYGYDDDSRLTSLTYKQGVNTLGNLTYTYDAAGQRTGVGGTWARTGLPAALASATYDDANQIATFGGTAFTYDDNGNLTSDGVRTYTWDARNQLASLSGPVSATFGYDGAGRRRTKTIGSTTTDFLYDGLNPVQELSNENVVANLLTGLGIDEYFTRADSAGVRNYLTDALRSTIALTDGAGVVQTEYAYDVFGETTTSEASTTNSIGFAAREADGTGLYFLRARYYDPRQQRFVSTDPAGCAGGINLYAYAQNAPTEYVDPLGLKPKPSFQGGGGSGGGGGGTGGGGGSGGGAGGGGDGPAPPPAQDSQRCQGRSWVDCMANCMANFDPLGPLGDAALTALGGTFPKSWIGQPTLWGSSPYTTVPSAAARGTGMTSLRLVGRFFSPVWIAYGDYLFLMELYCAAACAGNPCSF